MFPVIYRPGMEKVIELLRDMEVDVEKGERTFPSVSTNDSLQCLTSLIELLTVLLNDTEAFQKIMLDKKTTNKKMDYIFNINKDIK